MTRPTRLDRDAAPEAQREPKAGELPRAGFAAEGVPLPDPVLPDAVRPATPKKTMPWTPAPHAGALGRPLSRTRR